MRRKLTLVAAVVFSLMIVVPILLPYVFSKRFASRLGSARAASNALVAELTTIREDVHKLASAETDEKRKSISSGLRTYLDDASADAVKVQE
jgi:hypothetical protein